MIEKMFKLKENNTNVKTEVIAGITTFITMAYIIFVNPDIRYGGYEYQDLDEAPHITHLMISGGK